MESWRRGTTLLTERTKRYDHQEWNANQSRERAMVFSDFFESNEGRSRLLVASLNPEHPNYEANATLIEAIPDLVKAVKWINKFISTASDGGDAWVAVRDQPGASEWAKEMGELMERIYAL